MIALVDQEVDKETRAEVVDQLDLIVMKLSKLNERLHNSYHMIHEILMEIRYN